ncbi:MAG: aminopeptidase P family protein [Deltaproteobacteria bacterium]|nr:MAG: aminopeptidase P family protein [Deltaproteobacteria bacterium]
MMKNVPIPEIPREEFELRKKKAMKLMEESGLDGMLLFNNQNLAYYFGFRKTWLFQWLHAGLITKDGQTALIIPQIMHEVARQSTWVDDENIKAWGGGPYWELPKDPVEPIIKCAKRLGLENKAIGVEIGGPAYSYMNVGLSEYESVKSGLPKAKFVNSTPTIWKQRMIKTAWEIDLMKELCRITVKGIQTAIDSVEEGMTERQVLQIFWKTVISEGAFDTPLAGEMMFRGGAKDYAMSTGRAVDSKLTKGRQLFFDGGANLKGYQIDMQRQFCIGEPPALQRRLVEISERGQQTAEKMFKPGNRVSDVHKAAMSVIGKVPDDLKNEIHSLYSHTFMGHCEGLNIHEPPWITADEQTMMQPGMIFALEIPALDIPRFRVLGGFPEDLYLITPEGHEVLTKGIERKEFIK